MKTTITHEERRIIADSILDARQLLVGVDDHERLIALTLGVDRDSQAHDAISDAVAGVLGVDALLRNLHITVEDEAS